jgi:hypothetical protein
MGWWVPPDLVVLLLSSGEPVYGIVVEVQLGRDEKKPYSWPLYQAALRARLRGKRLRSVGGFASRKRRRPTRRPHGPREKAWPG